jgi:hypothetical protein
MAHALATVDGAGKRQDTITFDATKIIIGSNFNPRSDAALLENVARLKPQILAAGGILQRLWVTKDANNNCLLIDGQSRLLAFRELLAEGLIESPFIKVELFSGMGDEKTRLLMAITANEGKPLEKWELGAAYSRLVNVGMSKDDIAAKLGVSVRHVTEAIVLADTPPELRAMLAAGTVTTGAVMAEVKAVGASQAAANLAEAVQQNGGQPIRRERAKSNISLISAAIQLVDEAMVDQESPNYMTVTLESFNALKDAIKGL